MNRRNFLKCVAAVTTIGVVILENKSVDGGGEAVDGGYEIPPEIARQLLKEINENC